MIARLPLLVASASLVLGGVACSATPPLIPEEPAEAQGAVASALTGGAKLEVGPAKLWIGVADRADVGLRLDVLAEALLDGVVVSSGEVDDVAASSAEPDNLTDEFWYSARCSGPTIAVPHFP